MARKKSVRIEKEMPSSSRSTTTLSEEASELLSPHKRATFSTRISAHALDLVIVTLIFKVFVPSYNGWFLLGALWGYFFICDLFLERTLAKKFFNLYYLDKNENPVPKGSLQTRSFFRVLNVLAVLSWRKTSLLDALTGIRVYTKADPPKKKEPPKSRRKLKLTR